MLRRTIFVLHYFLFLFYRTRFVPGWPPLWLCATTVNAESLGELSALWFTPLHNSDRACLEHYAIVTLVSQFNYVFTFQNNL